MKLRTQPTQQRANDRTEVILNATASLLTEVGYEPLTMKAVAERAGSSIGAIYRYFPDKYSLVEALCHQYAEDLEVAWASLITHGTDLDGPAFALALLAVVEDFTKQHPAYLAIKASKVNFRRKQERRAELRERLAAAFRERRHSLSKPQAFLIAAVVLQIIHGMLIELGMAEAGNHRSVRKEFSMALTAYLAQALAGG